MEFEEESRPNFDFILEERIKFGRYQIVSLFAYGCIDFMDGVQLLTMTILLPIFKHEFSLGVTQLSILASSFYLGVFIGASNSGKWGDYSGRRLSALYGVGLQILFTLFFLVTFEFYSLTAAWLLYGMSFGFTLPLTTSMISEITVIKYRGVFLLFLNLFVSFGKLYSLLLAYLCLKSSLTEGHWKIFMLICCSPCIISLYLISKYVVESPRFLLKKQRFDEAFEAIDYIILYNRSSENAEEELLGVSPSNSEPHLTNFEKESLILESKEEFYEHKEKSVKELFEGEMKWRTIYFWLMWFFLNFMYFGQIMIIPFIFKLHSKGLGVMGLATLGEIPSILLSFYLIDKKDFGRRNSLIIFFVAAGAVHFVSGFVSIPVLTYVLPVARFFMKCSFSMIYAFTTEAHPTVIRTLAYGWCTAIGKFGSFVMPYFIFPTLEISRVIPFMMMGVSAILSAIAAYKTGIETRGITLNEIDNYKR